MRRKRGLSRRDVLQAAGSLAGLSLLPPMAWAEESGLTATPAQGAGPFYPEQIPLDHDNDLVTVKGRPARAEGIATNVFGRVLDIRGRPISDATVEIWQCDANGRYHHPDDTHDAPVDDNFQGFGTSVTTDDGGYRFRTIKPVHYPGRTPHIHFRIKGPGFEPLTTQIYVAGEPRNEKDFLYRRIRDKNVHESVTIPFEKDPTGSAELAANFDIVIVADGRFERG